MQSMQKMGVKGTKHAKDANNGVKRGKGCKGWDKLGQWVQKMRAKGVKHAKYANNGAKCTKGANDGAKEDKMCIKCKQWGQRGKV